MKKTMKKHYFIRKRKNQTYTTANYKHKKSYTGGVLPSAKLAEEAEETLSRNTSNGIGTTVMGMNSMGMNDMGMNDMGMNSMGMNGMGMNSMGMNQIDPSQLYQIYDDPFKIKTLFNLITQPITKIVKELYNIVKSGNIMNPNIIQTKLNNMANEIKDQDVKNLVMNYNAQFMNVYISKIAPSINIMNKLSSTSLSHLLQNLINNTYIYLIDNIKMTIINKYNNIVNTMLNNTSQIHTGLEFLNNNLITPPTNNNNYDNRFYTSTYVQVGGNKTNDSSENAKIHDYLLREIETSIQECIH